MTADGVLRRVIEMDATNQLRRKLVREQLNKAESPNEAKPRPGNLAAFDAKWVLVARVR